MDPEYREMGCIQLASSDAELARLRGAPEGDLLDNARRALTSLAKADPAAAARVAGEYARVQKKAPR